MKTYGLTGGIGMGKSTAAALLERRGIPVIDSDVIARQVVEPGRPALQEVVQSFGSELIGPDGQLRREDLARLVFADADKRRKLEEILHPRIRVIWQARLEGWRQEGRTIAVAVIPLLFETNAAGHFDATVCIACSGQTQRQRLRTRGWDDQQIDQRNAAQMPIEKKMLLADYVVWTGAGVDVHEAQLKRIIP
ncbi:MAG TPA: dephospho-CoA kinase [Verrucomicrobiae bacterium]|nr:dephospho-CoA kinase [Verrucomicrobiae bacterium]